jgi:hypothetical protein
MTEKVSSLCLQQIRAALTSPSEYDISLLSTNRACAIETTVDQNPGSPGRASSHNVSIVSPSSDHVCGCGPEEINSNSTDTSFTDASITSIKDDNEPQDIARLRAGSDSSFANKRRRLTDIMAGGYPGQFPSYDSSILHHHAQSSPNDIMQYTTGNPMHPNGEFIHTNFLPDPAYPAIEYTSSTQLASMPLRAASLAHAEHTTHAYTLHPSISAQRTESQDLLRKEIHRECSAARLESVSVGEYRYYQGCMSLEEYLEAGVCVCWGFCWCHKLCGRFPDVVCPCRDWIRVVDDH